MKNHRSNHWLTGMFTAAVAFAAVIGITPKTEAQTYQPQYITLLDGAITAGSTSNTNSITINSFSYGVKNPAAP